MENKFTNFILKLPKIHRINIPQLKLLHRIFLYVITIIFAVLSLVNVVLEIFNLIVGIVFYVCAAITLTVSVYYFVINIRHSVKQKIVPRLDANPFTSRVKTDYRYRTFTFAIPGLITGLIFAVFNAIIGLVSLSPWFGTLAAYYLLLSIMRIAILSYNKKIVQYKRDKKHLIDEINIYKKCGVAFCLLTIVLAGMVTLLLFSEEGKIYPGVTIYAIAAYTFYKITMSIINVVKTRKMKSPLLMAIRDIGFADSCVSVLSLQTAMFAAFGNKDISYTKIMNGVTGGVVCLVICITAIYQLKTSSEMGKRQNIRKRKGGKND